LTVPAQRWHPIPKTSEFLKNPGFHGIFILASEEQNAKSDFAFCPSEAKRGEYPAASQGYSRGEASPGYPCGLPRGVFIFFKLFMRFKKTVGIKSCFTEESCNFVNSYAAQLIKNNPIT
jgi:hypothetical protein